MRFLDEPTYDLTFSDVFLVPSRSEVTSRFGTDLAPGDGTPMTIPLVSANMTAVTGSRLAAALARRGGLGVLPQDLGTDDLIAAIAAVKSAPIDVAGAVELSGEATVADALARVLPVAGQGIVITGSGDPVGLDARELADADPAASLSSLRSRAVPAIDIDAAASPAQRHELLVELDRHFAPALSGGHLVGTLTRRGVVRDDVYAPAVDADGRLAVAVAVGINGDPGARAAAAVAAGADVIVVDTAHGHQGGAERAVASVAARDLGVPIVAGNVVTAEAVADLVAAGATIVKVGVGPGAMCTTRMMTAVGRPQFSAVLETALAARELGAAVWADGGVRWPRDVALALAAGASAVMVGSWFAGTVESPGTLQYDAQGAHKTSWGMASTRAVQQRFAGLSDFERAKKEMFAEGISSSRIPVDPAHASIDDLVDYITTGVRSAMTYAGARSLTEFEQRAVVGIQSAAGYEEGKPLPAAW